MSFRCVLVMTICVFVDNTGLTSKFPECPRLGFYWSCGTTWSIVLSRTRPKSFGKHRCWILMSPAINRLHIWYKRWDFLRMTPYSMGFPDVARSCILTSHVIKRLHIWQVKLRISDRWCHSQSMQRAFPVRAMVITSSEICLNFAVKIVFLLCFGALVRSDYWQVWTTCPKPQWTRLWRSEVELFEHCSAECRIRTQGLWNRISSKLNARWQTDWATENQAKKLELSSPSLWSASIQPTRPHCQLAFAPGSGDIHTCLLLLISMLWHRQAIFKSKGDKLSSSAECRIRTQGLWNRISSRLNARWQTDWATENQVKKLELSSPSLWIVWSASIQPSRPHCQLAFAPGSGVIHVCCC